LQTDLSGALLVAMNPSGVDIQGWRDVDRKYWSDR